MDRPKAFVSALEDFHRARQQAALEQVVERLRGKSVDLFSYEDVRGKLKARKQSQKKLEDVPLDAIVGSVGRYTDFTRRFLPKEGVSADRWARVKSAMTDMAGLPPIELYKIGDAYFVVDGHHRVSVAREVGAEHIQGYVTELESRVHLSPEDRPEDLVLKAEYAHFLEETELDRSRPGANLQVTEPGSYHTLLEHIQVHRYYMGLEMAREVSLGEAAVHWYDEVYRPVAGVIWHQGLLRDFQGRTETDLYLWLAGHRAALEEALEMEVGPEAAAADLAERHSGRAARRAARVGQALLDTFLPDELEPGPPPGHWRETRLQARNGSPDVAASDRLFSDVLVAVSGTNAGWRAVEQALELARHEEMRLHGVHVVPTEAERESAEARAIRAEFEGRLQAASVAGSLAVVAGDVSRAICRRARWVDLVILSLSHPPGARPLARLGSGFRTVLLRCPRPVLAVPAVAAPLRQAVLAYDGSPKAEEALFVATYLASRWGLSLAVVTSVEDEAVSARARDYLAARGVAAEHVVEQGAAAEVILHAAASHAADVILMGGYGRGPVLEAVLGSTVDRVLRESRYAVLVSR